MSTLMIGLLQILVGAGGFALTKAPLSLIPAIVGFVLVALGVKARSNSSVALEGASLAVGLVAMVFTASAVPRLFLLLSGTNVERPGDIFVLGACSLLSLVHSTLSIRRLFRSRLTS